MKLKKLKSKLWIVNPVNCKRVIALLLPGIILLLSSSIHAQPYLDIVNLKYTNSPNAGMFNQNKNKLQLNYFSAGTNLPIQFRNKQDAVIFSPFIDKWWATINNNKRQDYTSIGLPVSFSKTIPHSKWAILLTGILRMNDSSFSKKTRMQAGGALIISNKRNEHLTWKLGVYVNNELFGIFVIPLAGIDWRINSRNKIFGVLPGNLAYEHRINDHFYYGGNFRAITNSFGKGNGYWRIDENQLGLYLDTYLNKNIVFNIEAGHALYRKIRTGIKGVIKTDNKVNDNYYLKCSLAYRVRFVK